MTTEYRRLKQGDVLLDPSQQLWTVSQVENGIITLSDPYSLNKDRPIYIAVTEKPAFWEYFKFAWHFTKEGHYED